MTVEEKKKKAEYEKNKGNEALNSKVQANKKFIKLLCDFIYYEFPVYNI